jgi:glucokinase
LEKTYFAVDIGGTSTKYAILGENGSILSHGEMPTEAEKGGPHIVKRVKALLRKTLEEHSAPFSGVCISTAGIVDEEEGTILHAGPQIPEYKGVQWKKTIEEAFSLPCEVENDVNCAGLCENYFGAAKGRKSVLLLTIGTGIGGCFLQDGEVQHGISHAAMEIGYMQIPGGEFQNLASTSALVKRVVSRKKEPAEDWNGRKIFDLMEEGDKICVEEVERFSDTLSLGMSNLCYAYNPEILILGGGVMGRKEILLPKICAHLKEHLIPLIFEHTLVDAATMGNQSGFLGAFVHFQKKQEGRKHAEV